MAAEAPPTDPLLALFSGRREYKRHPVLSAVTLAGRDWEFTARCVDISAGGALLSVAKAYLEQAFEDDADDLLGVIGREFQGGLGLRFVDQELTAEAEIVRPSLPSGQSNTLYFGVCFSKVLSAAARGQLGLPAPPDHDDGSKDAPY